MIETRTGNRISCQSAEAVALYQQAIDLILGSESGAAETLDKALTVDNEFAFAAAARYFVASDVGETNADDYREQAQQLSLNASDWERQHIEVLIGLIDQPNATKPKALAYIENTPKDLFIIAKLTGNMFFFDGPTKLTSVLNLLESVADGLSDDWAFLARLGFAASEAGQRKRGRALIERALVIRPQSLYSLHGLAHVLHDEGAAQESATLIHDWLKVYESGARHGQMYGHIQWHLALSEWQMGDRQAAIQRYQQYCAPETTTCGPILTLADCGGFLLRDHLQSGNTIALTHGVRQHIETVWPMIGHPFVALHVASLYASAGDIAGLKRCEDTLLTTANSDNRSLSLALVSALIDFTQGNYSAARQTLETLSPEARIGIGGSNVERILVDLLELSCQANQ